MLGQSISSKYSKEMEEFMWECKHCHQQFNFETTSEKGSHSRWCAENPKRAKYVEDLAHARNIQKEKKAYANQFTSTKEKRQKNSVIWPGNQFTTKRASGHSEETKEKLRQINTGRKHTPETIEKIRSHALGSKHQRVCKKTVEYIRMDGTIVKMDSQWEIKLAQILDSMNVEWTRPDPITWVDGNGVEHHYFPDFYLPAVNLFLDPKNSYAREQQAEKINALMKQYNNIVILTENDICAEFIATLF